jgi:hypothetical protein
LTASPSLLGTPGRQALETRIRRSLGALTSRISALSAEHSEATAAAKAAAAAAAAATAVSATSASQPDAASSEELRKAREDQRKAEQALREIAGEMAELRDLVADVAAAELSRTSSPSVSGIEGDEATLADAWRELREARSRLEADRRRLALEANELEIARLSGLPPAPADRTSDGILSQIDEALGLCYSGEAGDLELAYSPATPGDLVSPPSRLELLSGSPLAPATPLPANPPLAAIDAVPLDTPETPMRRRRGELW